ncbi:MAG: hypothetical protein ACRC33_10165 [Gemmataceae bacterium]
MTLYHAFGGGLGHAARTLALARALRRVVGGRHVVNVNTPFAGCLREGGVEVVTGDAEELAGRLRPGLFVADTFPRGVCGELARLLEGWSACPRVLIARGLPAEYVARYQLRAWVRRHYDLVLCPGEPTPFDGVALPPLLLRERDELPPRSAEWPLVVGTGTVEECAGWAARAAAEPGARLALPPGVLPRVEAVRHFPLIEVLPRASRVIGAAGYNLVYECAFVGVPGEFTPMPRRYDDQARRASSAAGPVENGAAAAARMVAGLLGLGEPPA